MTKNARTSRARFRPAPTLCLAAILLLAGAASAHGAPEPRPFEQRILTDSQALGDYGGFSVSGPGAFDEGAWDLLALDTRDARLANGTPAWVVRVVAQSERADEDLDRTMTVSFTIGNTTHEASIVESGGVFSTPDADRVDGPVAVGDGHPQAWDLWLDARQLGLEEMGEAFNITVLSSVGGDPADVMPGGWYRSGVFVESPSEDVTPGTDTYDAPALPFSAKADGTNAAPVARLDRLVDANGTIPLELSERFGVDQFVTINTTRDGLTADVPDGIALAANATREIVVPFTIQDGDTGNLMIELYSDLGGWSRIEATLTDPADPPPTDTTAPPPDEDASGVVLPLLVLAVMLLARRRA